MILVNIFNTITADSISNGFQKCILSIQVSKRLSYSWNKWLQIIFKKCMNNFFLNSLLILLTALES